MRDRAKPSSEAVRRRQPHDDDKAQQVQKAPQDQSYGGKKPKHAESSGILRELAEGHRHRD